MKRRRPNNPRARVAARLLARLGAHLTRRRLPVAMLGAVALLALLASAAVAYYETTGSGHGTARTSRLPVPSINKATVEGTSVALNWSTVSAPGTGSVEYYVTRDGGKPGGNCPTSSAPSTVTSCTDTGLAGGSHSYTVTAVWRSWSSTSSPATEVQIVKQAQTVKFTSSAPTKGRVGEASYKVTATATSGLAVTLTVDASAKSVCSLSGSSSGSTVTLIGVGTCVIDVNQSGNGNFEPASQVQQSFSVGKGLQTIEFTSSAPTKASVGGTPYTVTATATSGLPVTLTVESGSKSVCSLSGSTSGSSVSFTASGTCVIDANQSGNSNYEAALQQKQSFLVAKTAQTIKFTSTAPEEALVGGSSYTVTATASSELAVTLTIASSSRFICSLSGSSSGSKVSFERAGTCTIDANQSGNSTYEAAPQVLQSFAVGEKLAITGNERMGSSGHYALTGEGFPGDEVSAEVCKVSQFPCPSKELVGTVTATVESGGEWTSSSISLSSSTTYFARATQSKSSAVSAVYTLKPGF
jgi:hypothetical protein